MLMRKAMKYQKEYVIIDNDILHLVLKNKS